MKTKIAFFLGLMFLASCANFQHAPRVEEMGAFPFGSWIEVKQKDYKGWVKGELIAVMNDSLFILPKKNTKTNNVQVVLKTEVDDYEVTLAKPKVPVAVMLPYVLSTLSHGVMLVATLPVNLITTAVVSGKSKDDVVIGSEFLEWAALHKYARFPQGIPKKVDVYSL